MKASTRSFWGTLAISGLALFFAAGFSLRASLVVALIVAVVACDIALLREGIVASREARDRRDEAFGVDIVLNWSQVVCRLQLGQFLSPDQSPFEVSAQHELVRRLDSSLGEIRLTIWRNRVVFVGVHENQRDDPAPTRIEFRAGESHAPCYALFPESVWTDGVSQPRWPSFCARVPIHADHLAANPLLYIVRTRIGYSVRLIADKSWLEEIQALESEAVAPARILQPTTAVQSILADLNERNGTFYERVDRASERKAELESFAALLPEHEQPDSLELWSGGRSGIVFPALVGALELAHIPACFFDPAWIAEYYSNKSGGFDPNWSKKADDTAGWHESLRGDNQWSCCVHARPFDRDLVTVRTLPLNEKAVLERRLLAERHQGACAEQSLREGLNQLGSFSPVTLQISPKWGRILPDTGVCKEDDWPSNLEGVGIHTSPWNRGYFEFVWLNQRLVFREHLHKKFSSSPAFKVPVFQVERPGFAELNSVDLYLCERDGDWELGLITPESRERDPNAILPVPVGDGDKLPLATVPSFLLKPWQRLDDEQLAETGWTKKDDWWTRDERFFEHKFFSIAYDVSQKWGIRDAKAGDGGQAH